MVYSIDGNLMDSIPLYHHYQAKETGWRRNVIQDRVTGSIYTTYEKDGYCYLGLVNVKTGEISEKVKLTFRYVDKIRVHNNYVYYVYRPFESIQKKFLYKENFRISSREWRKITELKSRLIPVSDRCIHLEIYRRHRS